MSEYDKINNVHQKLEVGQQFKVKGSDTVYTIEAISMTEVRVSWDMGYKNYDLVDFLQKFVHHQWEFIEVQEPPTPSAVSMLEEAARCIGDRASERDTEEERSMAATVRAFNGMFGTELTEEQGWHFMTLLKMSRSKGGDYREDDYVDGAAYFALAGECKGNIGE